MTRAVGIDVSQYQAPTWRTAGQSFAIIKGAYGDAPTISYRAHRDRAAAAGIPFGAYLFCRGQSAAAQVRALLFMAGDARFYVADYEADTGGLDVTHDIMRDIIRRLKQTGKQVGAYATPSTMHDWGQDFQWYAGPFGSDPPEPWTFQQHSSGVPGGDYYNGTPAQLEAWLDMPSIAIVQEELHAVTVPKGTKLLDLGGQLIRESDNVLQEHPSMVVTLGSDPQRYWLISAPRNGVTIPMLVRYGQAQDLGKVKTGGASAADLADAKAAGFADAKAKAIAAVQGI